MLKIHKLCLSSCWWLYNSLNKTAQFMHFLICLERLVFVTDWKRSQAKLFMYRWIQWKAGIFFGKSWWWGRGLLFFLPWIRNDFFWSVNYFSERYGSRIASSGPYRSLHGSVLGPAYNLYNTLNFLWTCNLTERTR